MSGSASAAARSAWNTSFPSAKRARGVSITQLTPWFYRVFVGFGSFIGIFVGSSRVIGFFVGFGRVL